MTIPANPDTSNSVGATDDASKGGLLNTGSDTILNGINNAIAANAEAAQTAATAAGTSATNAATSATNAATSATTASTKASEAAADAVNTAADAVNTAADRVQTGLDRTAASTSASNAATSETNAAGSATAAAGSASAVAANAAAAAASETAAAASETAAATSETNAATSASTASTKASEASTSATNAANSATSASTAQTAAETAKTNAETAETNAETAETNAANSATAAANSATASATSATNASNSASSAATSATNAATSETNAATSASTASTQATNASNSATSAATSSTNASNSASAASTSETNAAASESAAAASETAAASSETNAATSASTASTQATNASTSATAAATSATNSATSATASETAKTASEAARDQALAAFDNFDDKYLGEKSSDPTVDNDGDPLQAGMLYFDTTNNVMKVYTGSAWTAAYVSGTGFAALSGADFTGAITAPSINLASTTLVNSILDEDNMASNSATALSTQQAIKSYVDTQVATVPVGDITAVTAGTGLSGGGTSGAVTLDIDSTVATLTGTQTLTNKTLGATSVTGNLTFTGSQTVDGRDVSVDGTKLDTIETNADVTDTTNVTAAGALMDSEVTNLAQVKAFDSSDYATAAQGTLATNALPKSGGAMTGAITTNSTFDGRDVSVDGAKLDGIEAGATTDQTAAEIRALVESATDSNVFTDADHTKLNGIEASADVTDAANVEPLVDAHLNTSTASSSEVLSWTGTDYDWVVPASGADLYAANESSPSAQPSATGTNAIAIGDSAVASDVRAIALGYSSTASGENSSALGNATASGDSSAAVGFYAETTAAGSVSLGYGAVASGTFAGTFGFNGRASGNSAITLGNSYASGEDSLAAVIDNNTSTYGATGVNAIAIGQLSKATQANSIAIGDTAISTTANQIALGGATDTIKISNTYTLPTADGSANQVLTTNGSGVVSFADAGGGFDADFVIADKTATYTVVAGDAGKVLTHSANDITFNLTAAATLGAGFHVWIKNEGASGDITSIDPNGSETLDGRAIEKLFTGESIHIYTDGSNWYSLDRTIMWVGNTATDYYARPLAAGGGAIAGGLQSSASGVTSVAVGYTATATANGSTAIGANANATANRAVALGWSKAGGTDSLAAAITSGSASYGATAANSIAIGKLAKASGTDAFAVGENAIASGGDSVAIGRLNVASDAYSVAIGYNNTAAGQYSIAMGYRANANANYSVAIGQASNLTRSNAYGSGSMALAGGRTDGADSIAIGREGRSNQIGKFVFSNGMFALAGDAQGGQFILKADTTDATATVLTTNNSTAASTNQIVASTDTCIMFSGTLVAMQNGAQDQGGWEIKGLLKNDGGTTTLVSSNIQTFADGNGWTVALTADNTNNALAITCTGEAAHNIRWVANISTSEVTYA